MYEDIPELCGFPQTVTAAKERCPHSKWLPWLDQEFQWSEDVAKKYPLLVTPQGVIIDAKSPEQLACAKAMSPRLISCAMPIKVQISSLRPMATRPIFRLIARPEKSCL